MASVVRPSSVPARKTRTAISPRLAHRILAKGVASAASTTMPLALETRVGAPRGGSRGTAAGGGARARWMRAGDGAARGGAARRGAARRAARRAAGAAPRAALGRGDAVSISPAGGRASAVAPHNTLHLTLHSRWGAWRQQAGAPAAGARRGGGRGAHIPRRAAFAAAARWSA